MCQHRYQIRISRYDFWKRYVFSQRQEIVSDGTIVTSSGNSFHIRDPETRKVRHFGYIPTAERLRVGSTKRLVLADCRARQLGRSATRTKGPRYDGAMPCRTL